MSEVTTTEASISPGSKGRELVAVPDDIASESLHGSGSLYRIGVRSVEDEATYVVGEKGPNGQRMPWLYLRSGTTRYELDLNEGTLTVAITGADPEDGQAVVYDVDVEAMTGTPVKQGGTLRIVFAYEELSIDETALIDEWLATSGPQYMEELMARLGKSSDAVLQMQDAIADAKEAERFGHASRAPRSARPTSRSHLIEEKTAAQAALLGGDEEAIIELVDEPVNDPGDPEAIQVFDPASGMTYVGRQWNHSHHLITLRALKEATYRVAVIELKDGEVATVVLQHQSGLPALQLTTKRGVEKGLLSPDTWDEVLVPGNRFNAVVERGIKGQAEDRGKVITTAPMLFIDATALALPAGETVDYPASESLAHYRKREAELKNSSRRRNNRNDGRHFARESVA